jgi:hypothetical protein
MSPFWETLDKVTIAISFGEAILGVVLWVYLHRMSDDVDDIQEDVEDIDEHINNEKERQRRN